MSTQQTRAQQAWRRGELLAELFLQELEPEFVAQSTADEFAFDFLVGIANKDGGVNTFAVEVKATETPINETYCVRRDQFNRLVHSNIPSILLVIDVKQNRLFYAWPSRDMDVKLNVGTVAVPLTEVNEESRSRLRALMAR